MAKKITDEQIELINEVYFQCKVKTQTAKIVGVSVASVTKYLIDGYGDVIIMAISTSVAVTAFFANLSQFIPEIERFMRFVIK